MEFPFIVEKIRRKITGVATAIRLLMESKRLRKVLYLILTIGNYMNHGSCQGNAFGFLMEPTLDVLCTIKSNDEHMTLLAYVVHVLHTIDPDALNWTSDLDILWQVYKMEPDSIVTEIDALKRDMDSIKNELRLRKGAVIKIEELWLNRGIKISLNDIASRLRHLSKQGKHRFQAAVERYEHLNASDELGGGGAQFIAPPLTAIFRDSSELVDDEFYKTMVLFRNKSHEAMDDIECRFQKTERDAERLCIYFGFDEGKKWKELWSVFHVFREQFIEAESAWVKKEWKSLFRKKLGSEYTKTMSLNLDALWGGSDEALLIQETETVHSKHDSKASAFYAAFMKNKGENKSKVRKQKQQFDNEVRLRTFHPDDNDSKEDTKSEQSSDPLRSFLDSRASHPMTTKHKSRRNRNEIMYSKYKNNIID
eukprot:717670_1